MQISYKKLWILLVEKDITQVQLRIEKMAFIKIT